MPIPDQIIAAESGGNASARNPRSSAAGLGQFIDSTWLSMLAKHRPDISGSRDDLLALKMDPQLSREMTARLAADNSAILTGAGQPVTPGTAYLAHFAGPQGALGILNADPMASAASILGERAAQANPFLAGMSAGDLRNWADRKMGSGSPTSSAPAAPFSMAGPQAPAPEQTMAAAPEQQDDTSMQRMMAALQPQDDQQDAPMLLPPRRRFDLAKAFNRRA